MPVKHHVLKCAPISIKHLLICCLTALICNIHVAKAQDCDPEVPVLEVDLTLSSAATYISPTIIREGNCCGTTAPDRCIAFNITLHEGAQGIIFDICSGAVPPGALFYQIGCGPPVPVGNLICLDGTGPHYLTFCKPGNNQNQYCITSVPAPTAGPDTLASEGCSAVLTSSGYDPSTIIWTSVAPGDPGSLDGLLSCTNCENPVVTATDDGLAFAEYMVCGMPLGGCTLTEVCDTVSVSFASTLAVTIEPDPPAICDGEVDVEVTAIGSGGYPPYTFTWSNGDVGNTTSITAPGTYSVQINDGSGCPPDAYVFEVFQYSQPVGADAGPDQLICSLNNPIQLNGSFFGTDSAKWTGGNGTFIPDDNDPQATYIPTPEEIEAGILTLTLGVLPGGDCPGTTDDVVISIAPFSGDIVITTDQVSCFGANDGNIDINVSGEDGPYNIEWNQPGLEGFEISELAPGTYEATLYNSIGCPQTLEALITEPELLEVVLTSTSNPLCHDSTDGQASISILGGTPNYNISWSVTGGSSDLEMQNLPAGNHSVSVTDANGCQATAMFTLAAPPELFIEAEDSIANCFGNEFELQALAWGGTGNLDYTWNQGLGNNPIHMVNPLEDTVYTVFATDQNGCSTPPAEIAVTVISMPPDLLWISPDTGVCIGQPAWIQAHYDGHHPPYTYTWNPALPNGPGPHEVQPETSTSYQLTVTDFCANSMVGEVFVEVYALPEIHIEELLLTGCYPTTFTLFDTINKGPGYSHRWTGDEMESLTGNPANFTPSAPGLYELQLEVRSAEGCTNIAAERVLIEVYPSPLANFGILPQVGYIDNPNFTFFNQSTGQINEITWTIENQSFNQIDSVFYTFGDTGVYAIQLRVENEYGCVDSIVKKVTVNPVYNIIIPNAFTPAGSGGGGYYDPSSTANTVFYPFADYVTEMCLNIFNRWGELIFESNEFRYGWDGTYRDKPCPQDVYVYRIDFVFSDGVEVTRVGDLTLFR